MVTDFSGRKGENLDTGTNYFQVKKPFEVCHKDPF